MFSIKLKESIDELSQFTFSDSVMKDNEKRLLNEKRLSNSQTILKGHFKIIENFLFSMME
jgi:3-hydroxymyristoyl/3-hydroxydecanoyl-(acyl carrier protein) dehydratase